MIRSDLVISTFQHGPLTAELRMMNGKFDGLRLFETKVGSGNSLDVSIIGRYEDLKVLLAAVAEEV